MLNKILLIASFTIGCLLTEAQVSNNNIKNRSVLVLNTAPTHSNTNNASVEWDCVNKALTNKCLVYHNDQWFHFIPSHDGKFFINLSSQQCRDEQGIQLIVIEGNPCEVNTYRILQCVPKIFQDDFFIELDSLKQGTQYLVNIDGFLGDFCQFDIQFSTFPRGFPQTFSNLDTLNMTIFKKGNLVTIRWMVDESIAENTSYFKIYRTEEQGKKSTLIRELPLLANALGDYNNEYELLDSVYHPGLYSYRIIGIQRESEYPLLLDERQISTWGNTNQEMPKRINIPLNLKEGDSYLVLIFNKTNYSLLKKYTGKFSVQRDSMFEVGLAEFIKIGITEFIILASETNSNEPREFYFQYNGEEIVEK